MTELVGRAERLVLDDGPELHYVESGEGDPVVLLHGGMADLDAWGPQIEAFRRSYRVIAYSRRYNHPNSNGPPAPNHSAEVEAGDLAALIDALELGAAHLVGTSYGALTALCFAVARPQSVRSLVLAEPPVHAWLRSSSGGSAAYDAFMADAWFPAGTAFRQDLASDAMRLVFEGCTTRPRFDELPSGRRAEIMRNAAAMRALVLSTHPFPDVPRSSVAGLAIPTLLVRGEHAVEIHRLGNLELERVLPGAESVVIAGAGHGSPREQPAAFNAAVLAFLTGRFGLPAGSRTR